MFHGQNPYNGAGFLHIVDAGVVDHAGNFKADVDKVRNAIVDDIYQKNWLIKKEQDFFLDELLAEMHKLPKPVRDFGTTDPTRNVPTAADFKNTDYDTGTGVTKVEYQGYAPKVSDYLSEQREDQQADKSYIEKKYRQQLGAPLPRLPRNLSIVGSGGKHQITFASDIKEVEGKFNLGYGSITLSNGNFTLENNSDDPLAKVNSFVHAGYIIDANASLTLKLDGEATDAIHKIGKGKLTIAGDGNQLSPLNIGDGLVELNRNNGTATPHLKLASGRATVRLMQDGQLNNRLDNKDNNVAVGFGRSGGVLDFNGHDRNSTWIDIYHLDSGATLANSATGDANKVSFTFAPNGVRSFLGSFVGNFDLKYDTKNISPAPDGSNQKVWHLRGNSAIAGNFDIASDSLIKVGHVKVERAWGQVYDDRYAASSFISKTTNLGANATLDIGRHALYASAITVGDGATVAVHNDGNYVAADNPFKVANQHQLEKTIFLGAVDLKGANSKLSVVADKDNFVDIHSDISGSGAVTVIGQGSVSFGGRNQDFTGTLKFCDAGVTTTVASETASSCSNPATSTIQDVASVKLPSYDATVATLSDATATKVITNLGGYQGYYIPTVATGAATKEVAPPDRASSPANAPEVTSRDSNLGNSVTTTAQPTASLTLAPLASTTPVVDPAIPLAQAATTTTVTSPATAVTVANNSVTSVVSVATASVTSGDRNDVVANVIATPTTPVTSRDSNEVTPNVVPTTTASVASNSAPAENLATTSTTASATAAETTAKNKILRDEYSKAIQWQQDHKTNVANAQQQATMVSDSTESNLVPVPHAQSQAVYFNSKHALFNKAALVDTTNAKVVFTTQFTDVTAGELVTWDLRNVTGNAFLVKNDASKLQVSNYNLGGTFFINRGAVVADYLGANVVIAKDATLYADARHDGVATIAGKVVNQGTIYLTGKADQLPTTVTTSTQKTALNPSNYPASRNLPNLVVTVYPQDDQAATASSSVSANPATALPVLSSRGLELEPLTAEHKALLTRTSRESSTLASLSLRDNTAGTRVSDPSGLTTTTRNHDTLVIAGDYIGNDGKFVFDLNQDYYNVNVQGAIRGTTTLQVSDLTALTARENESFALVKADGGIASNAITLAGDYVTGGIFDYKLETAGDNIVLSSLVNDARTEVVDTIEEPTVELPAEKPTESVTETSPSSPSETPVVPVVPPTETENGNGEASQPEEVKPVPEENGGATSATPTETPTSPETEPTLGNPSETTSTISPTNPTNPTNPKTPTETGTTPVTEVPGKDQVAINTPAGKRYINSSVGSLLANRRFISNMNVMPANLAFRPGFYVEIDKDSESLEFTGATYTSSYKATRTLLGQNFNIAPNQYFGVFANFGKATATIDNQLNSATGSVATAGFGVTGGMQVADVVELSGAAQYLYADTSVAGTHKQQEILHGGFVAGQVAAKLPQFGTGNQYLTVKPYALVQMELTPTSHFVSRINEEVGSITADKFTSTVGVNAKLQLGNFAVAVDASKNLGSRVTKFTSKYTSDYISASNNNYKVNTTASYQVGYGLGLKAYYNVQGSQKTMGVGVDIKW